MIVLVYQWKQGWWSKNKNACIAHIQHYTQSSLTMWLHTSTFCCVGDVTNSAPIRAPAEAPATRSTRDKKDCPYFMRQEATPRWYMPRKPQPQKDKFTSMSSLTPVGLDFSLCLDAFLQDRCLCCLCCLGVGVGDDDLGRFSASGSGTGADSSCSCEWWCLWWWWMWGSLGYCWPPVWWWLGTLCDWTSSRAESISLRYKFLNDLTLVNDLDLGLICPSNMSMSVPACSATIAAVTQNSSATIK